jgi:hypothetical protein
MYTVQTIEYCSVHRLEMDTFIRMISHDGIFGPAC